MSENSRCRPSPIAVVGISAIFPDATNVRRFWHNILIGKDSIGDVPRNYWLVEDYYDRDPLKKGKTYARRGAFLPRIRFDPTEFRLPPKTLASIDSVQLLSLIAARDVLDDCRSVRSGKVDRQRISVILGSGAATDMMCQMMGHTQKPNWVNAMRESGLPEEMIEEISERAFQTYPEWTEDSFPGALGNVTAGRIANWLNLGGTNCVVDAACASSLGAVGMALQELQLGHSDLAITGGADASNDIFTFMCFSKTPALSPTGDCRPFSDRADGTLLGEGVGMVALRRLEDAERDKDHIYALVRGIGSSSDGMTKSIYAPLAEGQALAVKRAFDRAGFSPRDIELVEAHGTATRANDAAEFDGLRRVFGRGADKHRQWCALGSIKSQIGHTKTAAGAASLIKTVLALHHSILPPTIKVDRPNPDLDFAHSPFYLNTTARPWIHESETSRKASLSAFGFGGSNFHLALEEYRGPNRKAKRIRNSPVEMLLLSAPGHDELDRRICALEKKMETSPLAALARKKQETFRPDLKLRLAVLAKDPLETASLLGKARQRIQAEPERPFSIPNKIHYGVGTSHPKTAFLFPGEGSQYLNMGADLAMEFETARQTWNRVAGQYRNHIEKLHQVVFPLPVFGDEDRRKQADLLNHTAWAQPAVCAASLSQLRLLGAVGIEPDCTAGHGQGEIAALFAAGALTAAEDAISISHRLGKLMARIAEDSAPGAMTTMTASLPEVEKQMGPFRRFLDTVQFKTSVIPVYAGSTGNIYPDQPVEIRKTLAGQIARPVLFKELIEAMYSDGVRVFLEVGPGSRLTRLVTDCLETRDHLAVTTDQDGQNGVISFWNVMGMLASAGLDIRFESLWEGIVTVDDSGERKKWSSATVEIDGSNFGKPYPPKEGVAALPEPVPDSPMTTWAWNVLKSQTGTAPIEKSDPLSTQDTSTSFGGSERLQDHRRLTAFKELHDNLFSAHRTFQKTLAENHMAFIQSSQRVFDELDRMTHPDRGRKITSEDAEPPDIPSFQEMPDTGLNVQAVFDEANTDSGQDIRDVIAPDRHQESLSGDPPVMDEDNFRRVLIDIVSEQTGYPREVLDFKTDLESGLGIDSIKKMEILSDFQDRFPDIELQDTEALSGLGTLEEVVAFVKAILGSPGDAETDGTVDLEPGESPGKIHRCVAGYIPAPAIGKALAGLDNAGTLYIIEDNRGVAPILSAGLKEKGIHSEVVQKPPQDAGAVLFLKGINILSSGEMAKDAIELSRFAFEIAGTCGSRMRSKDGVFITVQDTNGDFGSSGDAGERAWSAGIAALAKTAIEEWQKASIKAIDIQCGRRGAEDIAQSILDELLAGGPEAEVGLKANGQRFRVDISECSLTAEQGPLRGGEVVMVSGGARGITAACLLALADRSPFKFVVLGRTAVVEEPEFAGGCETDADIKQAMLEEYQRLGRSITPAEMALESRNILFRRKIRSTLDELKAKESQVKYFAVDIRNADAVNRVVKNIHDDWGEIGTLIHAAGVISDKYIHKKAMLQFDEVFTTKVSGFRNLLSATRNDPLRRIFCFSSVAALKGHAGQVDYAMANETLNKVCQVERKRRKGRCLVKALNWGPWDAGMVTPQHRRLFEAAGHKLIPIDTGARLFVREMEDDEYTGPVEIILSGDLINRRHDGCNQK